MHYVIGDVHGCYDEMMALLNKIETMDEEAVFIFVGDFIDRGSQVSKVLNWCFKNISKNGKYRAVRGNHEQLAIEWYEEWLQWWHDYGRFGVEGKRMPDSDYDFSIWMEALNLLTPEKLEPYIELFKSLPLNREITVTTTSGKQQTYCIVHAFHDYSEGITEFEQEDINLWSREYDGNHVNDVIIVHGHTPTLVSEYTDQVGDYSRPGMICYRKNEINLDGGCVYSDLYPNFPTFLCGICLETLEEIYSCSLEERFVDKCKDVAKAKECYGKYIEKYGKNKSRFKEEMLKGGVM